MVAMSGYLLNPASYLHQPTRCITSTLNCAALSNLCVSHHVSIRSTFHFNASRLQLSSQGVNNLMKRKLLRSVATVDSASPESSTRTCGEKTAPPFHTHVPKTSVSTPAHESSVREDECFKARPRTCHDGILTVLFIEPTSFLDCSEARR